MVYYAFFLPSPCQVKSAINNWWRRCSPLLSTIYWTQQKPRVQSNVSQKSKHGVTWIAEMWIRHTAYGQQKISMLLTAILEDFSCLSWPPAGIIWLFTSRSSIAKVRFAHANIHTCWHSRTAENMDYTCENRKKSLWVKRRHSGLVIMRIHFQSNSIHSHRIRTSWKTRRIAYIDCFFAFLHLHH